MSMFFLVAVFCETDPINKYHHILEVIKISFFTAQIR